MKKLIYVDMDDTLCNFTAGYIKAKIKNPLARYPQSKKGFFVKLRPIEDAVKVVKRLDALDEFEVYILTAPSVMNPLSYTEKRLWIEEHFGMDMVNKLIISPNKGLNMGHYLIDDNTEGKGQENFQGELIHFGSKRFANWQLVWTHFAEMLNK